MAQVFLRRPIVRMGLGIVELLIIAAVIIAPIAIVIGVVASKKRDRD
ncbi:MAG: hypothetical protein VB853_12515 [Pirellulales bacterium]